MFSVVLLLTSLGAAVRGQSAIDGFDPKANGAVRVVVVQPDGKILIGGDFTSLAPNGGAEVARNRIARLNPDGTVDVDFNPDADGIVFAIAFQADGKVLAGGLFGTIGGATRNRIARLDATTGQTDSFDPQANGAIYAIAVQADGKILVGGTFNGANSIGGQPRNYLARLDATTGLADSFDPNANAAARAIVLQADGKILVGGDFAFGPSSIGGEPRNYIARLDATSGLADSFNPSANDVVRCMAVQADGKILVGGDFAFGASSIGGKPRDYIARLDAATGAADSFDASAGNVVYTIAVQADGKILVGGAFTGIRGQPRNYIARLEPTGSPDLFNPIANGNVNSIAVQADGKILAGGDFGTLSPNGSGVAVMRSYIARLETDGSADQTLDAPISGQFTTNVNTIAIQPDGKILIGGQFTKVGNPHDNIARLNKDGTLDTRFSAQASSNVYAITLQADGYILVGGNFTNIGGAGIKYLARLDVSGEGGGTFDANANGSVSVMAVQPDGKILVAGAFTNIGGDDHNFIARLDPMTGAADSFNPDASGGVYAIAVQADGKILVGGAFGAIGGQARVRIARLDPTTGLADSFDPNANDFVHSIVVQPDGKILVGGDFTEIGGAARNRIARLDPNTGLADSFDPNADDTVRALAVQADGRILAAGDFTAMAANGGPLISRGRFARLEVDGELDSFDPQASFNPQANPPVVSIAVQPDGKILAGGDFTSIGGQTRNFFARLKNDTIARQDLTATQTGITWTHGGSSPQFIRVAFEYSTGSLNYNFLGHGSAVDGNWTLTGLNLPTQQNLYIRARGYYATGNQNGSESVQEFVRNVFLVSAPTPTPTATPTPTPTPTAAPTLLGNISTRLRVETGDNVLIGGFIVTGTVAKKVIVRGIGTSLPFVDRLENPILELRDSSGALLDSNDNWKETQQAEIEATTIPPRNDLESAIIATLPANGAGYTAIVRGVDNGTGIGVVEAYDLDSSVDSKLANISTRGFVQTGDNVLIAGTIVVGQASQKVIVRAIGPSLPVFGNLEDPSLELRDGNGGLVADNDNWRSNQEGEIIATTIPPSNDFESAIVTTLPAGGASYTAIVRGVGDTTGIAVVEVYALTLTEAP